MRKDNRIELGIGLLLILLGAWFFALQRMPVLSAWFTQHWDWPFYVVAAGALIVVLGLLTGAPAMAIPACIVAGIGGILYFQSRNNDWTTWSFLWTLIPGFVGVGTILTGLFGQDTRHNLGRGTYLLAMSGILFVIFAAAFGGLGVLGPYGLPALLILLGVYVIGRGFVRSRRQSAGR
jgi:hypothetical protein